MHYVHALYLVVEKIREKRVRTLQLNVTELENGTVSLHDVDKDDKDDKDDRDLSSKYISFFVCGGEGNLNHA